MATRAVTAPALAVRTKPRLTFWEIWNMSFGFLGIQIGFALQNANVSRIFETLGAKVENIPLLWIAAPVTGLVEISSPPSTAGMPGVRVGAAMGGSLLAGSLVDT